MRVEVDKKRVLYRPNFLGPFQGNPRNKMECSVCFAESGPFQKLCCGHTFCKGCIKQWYAKGASGANTSCPLCRRPMYWRGFHEVKEEWDEEAYENKCADVFSQALDETFSDAQEFAEQFPPRWRKRIFRDLIEDFLDLEKTYRFLKNEHIHPDDMEEVFYYGDYYSDRHMDKCRWLDEPPKEWMSRYPEGVKSARCGSRRRAAEDEWCTVSLYIQL